MTPSEPDSRALFQSHAQSHAAGDEPVFGEPWEAQVFALAVKLYDAGHFTWLEWSETLGREIEAVSERGEPDTGEKYYEHWLKALEKLLEARGLASPADVTLRQAAWEQAHKDTPHGEPVALADAVKSTRA